MARAALLLMLLLVPAMASAADFAVVRGGRLNLRANANSGSYSLGLYGTGSWVRVDGGAGNGWYAVTTMDGKRGYMAGNYLNFGASANSATVRYAVGGYVNLRSAPSMDAGVIMQVSSGMTVSVQGSYGSWQAVSVATGVGTVSGYMLSDFLELSTPAATVTTRNGGKVNVRSGPSSRYGSLGSLPSGTRVTVTLKGNGWYRITGGGLTGFMSTSYISGSGSTVGSNTGRPGSTTASQVAYVNNPRSTQVLNLRDRPSQSARSIGQYRNGTQVKVIAYGGTWCEVYVGTRHGYMMTRYLVFTGNAASVRSASQVLLTATPSPVPTIAPTAAPTLYAVPQMLPDIGQTVAAPKAGTPVTLLDRTGAASAVNVYSDAAAGTLLTSVPSGTQATLLTYGSDTCMVLLPADRVGHVYTQNISF